MVDNVSITYVVASKLGTIGMGSTAYHALKGIEKTNLSYKGFCRGYNQEIKLKKKNLSNLSFLEYLSYPFRFLEKFLKIRINSFLFVNYLFGKFVNWDLPKTKIYHSWMGLAPEAVKKAKKHGAIMVLEGANSHPHNLLKILEKEYSLFGMKYPESDKKQILKQAEMIKNFDYVMCPSKFVYDSFSKEGFSKKQLIFMPYGVDNENFYPIKKKNKKIKFIFIGSMQLRKGVQYLLQAWEELALKDAELVLVGRVWPDAHKITEKYKQNSSIKFLGFSSNPKKILQSSDVFISPSLEEGSALTCYEALACGLPIIATSNSGSVVRDKKDGFIINARDVEKLKEKILYFYKNPEKIKDFGRNAVKRAGEYSWKNYEKKLSLFYKKILKK